MTAVPERVEADRGEITSEVGEPVRPVQEGPPRPVTPILRDTETSNAPRSTSSVTMMPSSLRFFQAAGVGIVVGGRTHEHDCRTATSVSHGGIC